MERPDSESQSKWHCAINRHSQEQREVGGEWPHFMYEAKSLADEVPRMAMLFKRERESALPKTHQQCSMQKPVEVKDNRLTCCLGVKTMDCPHVMALDGIANSTPEQVDIAKAWTCAAHILMKGGDTNGEGYLMTVDDAMFWQGVYANMFEVES